MESSLILIVVVVAALAFDFTNGFHDTANVVATAISTRAMGPRVAIAGAAVLNFVGALISVEVATTVGKGLVEGINLNIIFAGLIGAIVWNLATWYVGLPSSSSHALLGGLIGATFFAKGPDAIIGDGVVNKIVVPALVSPVLAFLVAGLAVLIFYRLLARSRPGPINRGFRLGQIVSGGLLAIAHGTNDGQKTMGIITLALVSSGHINPDNFHVPLWVQLAAATAIAAGTYAGGWKIINTLGNRIHKMDSAQGFAAQSAGAAVILTSSHLGFPLSTTHTISGGIIGSGAAKSVSTVKWGVAGNMLAAWVMTIPAAGCTAGLVYGFTRLFGTGATGPVIVSIIAVIILVLTFLRRGRSGPATIAAAAS